MNSKIEMRLRMSAVQWHSPSSRDQYDARWCDSPPCVTICFMAGRECHCKQWIADGETHDCWTTTEAALTQDLSDDLRDPWDRLREALRLLEISGSMPPISRSCFRDNPASSLYAPKEALLNSASYSAEH